ncbi:hypothetical protein OEIGOIKO_04723 [Streptomyces chrestomyceticus JCM 4735]|uniref:Secreted protein n=1 Tax=Streptomyces chrestomyceticus JCM 4735 TaxID=1306181 RepID=A0A7U9KWZ3_9ACTN|nr:hypothetical protein [Streptomyces chrestomyceticus]GCD36942.1 hypothetical protein OEIGOIKO_04723 [Streptomyces chrestomyceticus JCM 4735]
MSCIKRTLVTLAFATAVTGAAAVPALADNHRPTPVSSSIAGDNHRPISADRSVAPDNHRPDADTVAPLDNHRP